MALKGFLASGFQQLIGASRLKGANAQWVGEPNRVTYASDTVPITASLVNGFNYVEWTPVSNISVGNAAALFSSTPTAMTQVTIKNTGSTFITFSNAGTVSGSCVGLTQLVLRPGEQATFMYDLGSSRWQEMTRGPHQVYISGTAVNPYAPAGYRHEIASLNPGSDVTIDTISTFVYQQSGDMITFISNSTNLITFQQDPTGAKLVMNGDCVLTKYSSITFVYYQFKWVELSRNMVGGY